MMDYHYRYRDNEGKHGTILTMTMATKINNHTSLYNPASTGASVTSFFLHHFIISDGIKVKSTILGYSPMA
jgi:hypothetical protein